VPIAYLTDVEGRWDKLESFVSGNPLVSLADGRLILAPGATLVFGGDAVDRGPAGRRVVATLLAARREYGERVILLAGNRDLNKLRLSRELTGHPPPEAPAELHDRPADLLRWIFAHTMGARMAFENRRVELAASGAEATDEAVVQSFIDDVAPEGPLTAWLAEAQLAYRSGSTLFVHGAVTADSLGTVPGRDRIRGVDRWIDALNAFYADQLRGFATGRPEAWAPIIAYQAPIPGTRANQASVVYGRLADDDNDPRLPEPIVVETLLAEGVRRLVVGHTPMGDVPAILRSGAFTLVLADNSYSRAEVGPRVLLDDDTVAFAGRARLDDGATIDVAASTDQPGPIGRVNADGRLIKAPVGDRWLLFKALPQHRMEQVIGPAEGVKDPPALG
jgi:hypothetical protein